MGCVRPGEVAHEGLGLFSCSCEIAIFLSLPTGEVVCVKLELSGLVRHALRGSVGIFASGGETRFFCRRDPSLCPLAYTFF